MFGGNQATSTLRLYENNLRRLHGGPFESIDWLKKTKPVLAKINEMPNPNTRRTYLISVVMVLKDKPGFKRAYNTFHEAMMALAGELNKESFKSDHTLKKIESLDWNKLCAVTEPSDKQSKLIRALYCTQAPRRAMDYFTCKMGRPMNTEDNWCDWVNFYFNKFKNKNSIGSQIMPISPEVKALLPPLDGGYLISKNGRPVTSAMFGRMVKQAFNDDAVGVSVLRNLYLSYKYGKATRDLKQDVEAMGTSVGVAQATYIR